MHTHNQDASRVDSPLNGSAERARQALEQLLLLDAGMLIGYLGMAVGGVGGLAGLAMLTGILGGASWPFILLLCGIGMQAATAAMQHLYARRVGQALAARREDLGAKWAAGDASGDEIRECRALMELKDREYGLISVRMRIKRMLILTAMAIIVYLWADLFLIGKF